MALIAARAKFTYGDDKVVSRTSESLNVNLPRPIAPTFTIPGANIVAGDKWNPMPEWGDKSASLAVNSGSYTNVGKTITLNNVVFSLLHQYRSGDNVNKIIERGSKGLENFTDSRFDIYSSVDVTITPSTGESFTYNLARAGAGDWYYAYGELWGVYDVPLKQFYNFLWVHRGKAATITLAFKV